MKIPIKINNETIMLRIDDTLKSNLDIARKAVTKDWDMLGVIDGAEGSGKSVLAQQLAKYCDPTFNINNICFTPKEFKKSIIKSQQYQSIIYDEGYTGLSARATMSTINKTLISMLAEIRQKNLFVFVIVPTFFDLDKYVALWRSRYLIHVYCTKPFQRGTFAFFNVDRKKDLYILGKKFYSYAKPKANFLGTFNNLYTVDETAYRKKKRESLIGREKYRETLEKKRELEEHILVRLLNLKEELNLTHEIIAKIVGIPISTYFYKRKQWEKGQELISLEPTTHPVQL